MDKPKHKYEELLMEAIGFTEEDLEVNREGILTNHQRPKLINLRIQWSIFLALALAACPVGSILAIIHGMAINDTFSSRAAIVALICTITGIISLYCWIKQRSYYRDADESKVVAVEGRIELNISSNKNGNSYQVVVSDQLFNIDKTVFLALKNGDPYLIYYSPNTNTILSAEWLRETNI